MRNTLLSILFVTPIFAGCTSDKGASNYQVTTAKPSQGAGGQVPNRPPLSSPVKPPVQPPAQPLAQPPTQPSIGIQERALFGKPGQQFDIRGFVPAGFSPEKTLTEEQFIRERKGRGCQSSDAQGIKVGAAITTFETSYTQFGKTQVYFEMHKTNKLTAVSSGQIGYTRSIKNFRSESLAADIVNKEEKCSYIFGPHGGFTRCPFVRGNLQYQSYVGQLDYGKNCKSAVQSSRGQSTEGYYISGKFTLPNGQVVRALLSKSRIPRIESCDNRRSEFNDYSVQVISEKVQSADGTCAQLFDLTIYQADGRYNEWSKVVRSAPLK